MCLYSKLWHQRWLSKVHVCPNSTMMTMICNLLITITLFWASSNCFVILRLQSKNYFVIQLKMFFFYFCDGLKVIYIIIRLHCQISTSPRAPLWRKFGPFPGCGPWYVGRLSHQTITLIWWLMSLPFNGSTLQFSILACEIYLRQQSVECFTFFACSLLFSS
jgi:hypothetical protein